jgi:hypothetical protein
MDMDTLERLFDIASKDFPEMGPREYLSQPIPKKKPAEADDFSGQQLDLINKYLRAFQQMTQRGEPIGGEEQHSDVYHTFVMEMSRLLTIFEKSSLVTPRYIERAARRRTQFRTEEKMEKFVQWFGIWVTFSGLPLQYKLIKQEIVDKEQLFDEREFNRKLHRLCDIGMLERVEHIRPNPIVPEKRKPNVYYKVNPDFYERHTDMIKLQQFIPEILTLIASLMFEKTLALSFLRENNLYQQFEEEKKAFSALLEVTDKM